MSYYIFLYFSLLCALFLNTDAAFYLGVKMLTTAAFTPMVIAILLKQARNNISLKDATPSIIVFIITIVIITVKFLVGDNIFQLMLNFTILPVCITAVVFDNISSKEKKLFKNSLLCFFGVECSLAIIEKILHRRFFDTIFTSERYEHLGFEQYEWQFRSTSLLGHPLENAMVVSVMMAFILASRLKVKTKIALFSIGYISLYCFNARGAIIVTSIVLLPFLFKIILREYKKSKIPLFTILILAVAIGGYFLLNSSLSGRLFNEGNLGDSSGQERVKVFSYLAYLKDDKLIIGNSENYHYLLDHLGIVGIENGIIAAILVLGYLFAIPLLISLFYFQWKKLNIFNRIDRIVILIIFWALGFVNPNLIDPTQWYIFVFSFLAFKPEVYDSPTFINLKKRSLEMADNR